MALSKWFSYLLPTAETRARAEYAHDVRHEVKGRQNALVLHAQEARQTFDDIDAELAELRYLRETGRGRGDDERRDDSTDPRRGGHDPDGGIVQ
jgi:hypothetical protein